MRSGAAVVLVLLAAVPAFTADSGQDYQEHYLKAATTILCDCGCHPQSTHECACGRAAEMRNDILALARQGLTGQQIIDKYVAEYGEQIRIAPTADGFNLVAWLGPSVALVGMSAVLLFVLRGWRRERGGVADEAGTPPVHDPATAARLRAAMEEWD